MTCFTDTFSTPFGPFSIAVDEQGAVVATAFGTQEDLRNRATIMDPVGDKIRVGSAREQVLAWCAGERRELTLPLAAAGTPFQHRVWAALQRVPFGTTRTYGQIAAELGIPAAARAVGRANATNPICLIVPCHRVVGADGSLTGFAFGEEIKSRLLEHERAVVMRFRAA